MHRKFKLGVSLQQFIHQEEMHLAHTLSSSSSVPHPIAEENISYKDGPIAWDSLCLPPSLLCH